MVEEGGGSKRGVFVGRQDGSIFVSFNFYNHFRLLFFCFYLFLFCTFHRDKLYHVYDILTHTNLSRTPTSHAHNSFLMPAKATQSISSRQAAAGSVPLQWPTVDPLMTLLPLLPSALLTTDSCTSLTFPLSSAPANTSTWERRKKRREKRKKRRRREKRRRRKRRRKRKKRLKTSQPL